MNKKQFKKVYIEITNICNLNCSFCPPDERKKKYMTIDNFKKVLNVISDYTNHIYLHVKGEPLMHPKINEFIALAYKMHFKVNITTNGTLIDRLTNTNIRQINYSMQSSDKINEIRNTIHKLKNFIEGTDIYLSLRMWSKDSQNNQSLKEMLLEEFNVADLKDKQSLSKNIFLSIEEEFVWPDLNNNTENNNGYCYGLKDHIAILVDGTVIPCCLDYNGRINLGNIFKQDLKTILATKKTQDIVTAFQHRQVTEPLCKKCQFKNKF